MNFKICISCFDTRDYYSQSEALGNLLGTSNSLTKSLVLAHFFEAKAKKSSYQSSSNI